MEAHKNEVKAKLINDLPRLIAELLPAATKAGDGWRIGNLEGDPGESLSISSEGLWFDHADHSKRGDVLSLIHAAKDLPDFPAVLNWACDWAGMPQREVHSSNLDGITLGNGATHKDSNAKSQQEVQEKTDAPNPERLGLFIHQAREALKKGESPAAKQARAYLEQRGLTSMRHFGVIDSSVTAPAFDVGYRRSLQGRLLIAYQHVDMSDVPVYFNARDLTGKAEEKYKYMRPKAVKASVPFNAGAIHNAKAQGQIIITEGELDAISLLIAYGSNYPVIGASSGILPPGWHERIAKTGLPVFILADNDGPGREKAETMQARLAGLEGAGSIRVAHLNGYKDANEALRAVGAAGLVEAVESALTASKTASISDYLYITETWLAELDARAARTHSHYSTGMPALDKLLGGGYLEGLHLIGGITGGGKTSLALSIAIHNALEGRPVLYGSYEQSRLELWARIASRITGVPQRAIKTGKYNLHGKDVRTSDVLRDSDGWEVLQQLSKYLKIVEGGDALSGQAGVWSVETLRSTAREAAEAHGAPPLLIIDYLQRMPVPADMKIRDVRERVGAVAGMLQTMLGRELSAPILALSSVGRASYNAEVFAKAPLEERLTAFKEAGELEYTSYTALLLYGLPRNKQGDSMEPPKDLRGKPIFLPRVLDLVKNREGITDRVAVRWDPKRDTWSDAVLYGSDSEAL